MSLARSAATPRWNQRRGSKVFFRSPEHFYRFKPGRTENHLGHKRELINLFVRSFSLGGVEVFRVPKGTMVTLRPGVWHHGPFCVDTDSLQTLIILPERLYAYDCTVLTAPEADKLRMES